MTKNKKASQHKKNQEIRADSSEFVNSVVKVKLVFNAVSNPHCVTDEHVVTVNDEEG